ncbi:MULTISPECIES: SRPBCC domain-containing protein [unclassified Mesorhizobium]|uniref:SRPBCC domain-containing protein n=1 Tax=unclassified Mesorhizobium TaxID=325217 RepID=UPI001CCC080F|nr:MULTISPECIES: SRPBCC domain-containing protein [unclassified Mesorhizobium]MBZ9683509.1 SRPBCC domain-containing protein [Mesorhizobium sp. CO1-1-2]MBZ9928122.1 SRPBCC domain-containing protein [Mesorhizobium sp. BR1-1-4]
MTMNNARAIADLDRGLILATVDIEAPVAKVFSALTNPADLPKWWGQAGIYQTTSMTADLREGGTWRSEGVGADGVPFSVAGAYTIVEPPHRVEFTWKPDWDEAETLVSFNLKEKDGTTRVTLRHSGFGDNLTSCESHAAGWEMVFGWLNGFATAETSARTAYFLKLYPPRPTFALDLTDAEKRVMKEHGQYWYQGLAAGSVVVFGPVNHPDGAFGLGVVRVKGVDELTAFQENDPAITSGLGFRYEASPMFEAIS